MDPILARPTRVAWNGAPETGRRWTGRTRAWVTALVVAVLLPAVPVMAADWLQWGGPAGDFNVKGPELKASWPDGGPKQLWKRPLGGGYSSVLVQDGRLFTMYRDGDDEVVVALEAGSGKTVWEHRYTPVLWPDMTPQFGLGPNSTPLIVGDRLVSTGIDGQVRCLELDSGKLLWRHDLPSEYGRRKRDEEYGYSASPMLYGRVVIVQVGGDEHAVVAFNPGDGTLAWKSEAGGVSYAQATLTKLAGRDHFIYFSPEGVNALDPATGETLWHAPVPVDNGNHLTPIVKCDDNHIWVGSQFLAAGGRLLEIVKQGDGLQAKLIWHDRRLRTSHWTLIRLGDLIYGSTGGNSTSFLTAFNWRTGKTIWRERGYHKAQALYSDGKLLFLDESGKLVLGRVSPEGFELLDSAEVAGSVSWTLPTLVDGTLYVRDTKSILALDLAAARQDAAGSR